MFLCNSEGFAAYLSKISERLDNHLLDGLQFINWKNHLKKDSVVFIKPNFTFPYYQKGVTTSPNLLKSLLKIICTRSSNVILGESNGGNHSFTAEDAFKGHQMNEICKEFGVNLLNLSNVPSKTVVSKIQSKTVKIQLPKILLEKVDCFISVPVLKVHVMTGVSLGLKNLWGCYPDTMRGLYHQNLDCKLTLMAKLLKPKITIVDGLYGLNNHGPMYGDPVHMNLVIVSNNLVVSDILGAKIMRIPLKNVKHVATAQKEQLGPPNLKNVRINEDWQPYAKTFRIKRTLLDNASSVLFNNDILAKLVLASRFTPFIYKITNNLKSRDEELLTNNLKTHNFN